MDDGPWPWGKKSVITAARHADEQPDRASGSAAPIIYHVRTRTPDALRKNNHEGRGKSSFQAQRSASSLVLMLEFPYPKGSIL